MNYLQKMAAMDVYAFWNDGKTIKQDASDINSILVLNKGPIYILSTNQLSFSIAARDDIFTLYQVQ